MLKIGSFCRRSPSYQMYVKYTSKLQNSSDAISFKHTNNENALHSIF